MPEFILRPLKHSINKRRDAKYRASTYIIILKPHGFACPLMFYFCNSGISSVVIPILFHALMVMIAIITCAK